MYKLLPGPLEKKEALNTRGKAYMPPLVRQGVERTMAIPLDTNPNHGSDNRVHEAFRSFFRGGPYTTTQSRHAQRDFQPTKIASERHYGEADVGA